MNIFALIMSLLPTFINIAQATQKPGATKLATVLSMSQQIAAILAAVLPRQPIPTRAEIEPHIEVTLANMKATGALVKTPVAPPAAVPLPHAR